MPINWTRLIRAIKNEGTVLFIGPNLQRDLDNRLVYPQFCQKMVENYAGEVSFDDKDGFFFFIEPAAKSDVVYDMKEYYETLSYQHDVYERIAAIPFHLIISLCPDDALHQVLDENNVKHQFAFYDSYKADVEKPSIDEPLVYNLFGLATQGKYILTQEDYYNYIKSVIGEDVLPKKIVSALSAATNFIFLGFDFEKWYVRLLLMILNFHLDKEGKTRHTAKPDQSGGMMDVLIEKQFNITVAEDTDLDFVKTFHTKLQAEKMLKTLTPKVEMLIKQIDEKALLIERYEEKMTLSDDPKETLRCRKSIDELNQEMEELQKTLKTMAQ